MILASSCVTQTHILIFNTIISELYIRQDHIKRTLFLEFAVQRSKDNEVRALNMQGPSFSGLLWMMLQFYASHICCMHGIQCFVDQQVQYCTIANILQVQNSLLYWIVCTLISKLTISKVGACNCRFFKWTVLAHESNRNPQAWLGKKCGGNVRNDCSTRTCSMPMDSSVFHVNHFSISFKVGFLFLFSRNRQWSH